MATKEQVIKAKTMEIAWREENIKKDVDRIIYRMRRSAQEIEQELARVFEDDEHVSPEERISWVVQSISNATSNFNISQLLLDTARYSAAKSVIKSLETVDE